MLSFFVGRPTPFSPHLMEGPVLLRRARRGDYAHWAALRADSRAHLAAWEEDWTPNALSMASFRARLKFYDDMARRKAGLWLLAFDSRAERLIGGAALSSIRYGPSCSAILSYWVGASFTRRGYGAAAVGGLVRHGFEALGLNRIEAACQQDNEASKALLAHCGFDREGLAKEYLRINGVLRDHELYALTAAAYAARENGKNTS